MRLRKSKKGDESFWTVIKIALMIVVLIIAFNIIWKLVTGKNILESLFDQYTEPQLSKNAYFSATTVKFVNQEEMRTKYRCTENPKNVWTCDKNVEVEIAVAIKNTGSLAIPVYARPRIGNECDAEANCDGQAWLEGSKRCLLMDIKEQDCSVGYKYIFDNEDTEFRIYPGAYMKKEDYLELTKELSTTDIIVYNKNSWLILNTR